MFDHLFERSSSNQLFSDNNAMNRSDVCENLVNSLNAFMKNKHKEGEIKEQTQ